MGAKTQAGAKSRQPAAAITTSDPNEPEQQRPRTRTSRGPRRVRGRESAVVGLVERARKTPSLLGMGPLLDPLFSVMPTMRAALLNRALDDALRQVGAQLAVSLAPCFLQVWIAEPAVWAVPGERIGGLELFPTLRLRVDVTASGPARVEQPRDEASDMPLPPDATVSHDSAPTSALIEEVATRRKAVALLEGDERLGAPEWFARTPALSSGNGEPQGPAALVAIPLRARGQFLGVVALATRLRLAQRHLTALEELTDLMALAADRDRLLSYSRTQEALAQTMVRHAPVAMALLTGHEHIIALANPAFYDLLGVYEGADALGRRLRDALGDRADRFITMLRLDAVYHGSESQAMIELPIHLDRGMTYWNVTTSPVAAEEGAMGGVLVAAVDVTRLVTARQRAQDSAEMAQERMGQMLSLHATTLATASQVGGDPHDLLASILHRSIALLNAQAGVIYSRERTSGELEVVVSQGLRREYVGSRIQIGQGLAGLVAQAGKGRIIDDYRAFPAQTAIYEGEAVTAIISVPLEHHGQVIGVLDVLDDAERRAFTDDDLWLLELFASQAAQAMENARMYVELESAYRKQRDLDRMKDDFIATASHELRTPLTGVQGFLDLLRTYPTAQSDPMMYDFIVRAADSADELVSIAESLLQTSRLDTGHLQPLLTPVRLAHVCEQSLRAFGDLQEAHGRAHDLILDVPQDVFVQADLVRLKEVINNLISNAIKYSPHGGRVRVTWAPAIFDILDQDDGSSAGRPAGADDRPTVILNPAQRGLPPTPSADDDPCAPTMSLVEASAHQRYHALLVHDDGMGIPESERALLFGRFSRLESARVSQIRGVGLGLYICRQSMRAMNGDVWLHESVPGKGSVFALALPAADAHGPVAQ